ncbi:lipid-binding SYLF domain-containing protein [Acidisoma cellulosilytica]|uniref:Lipid-binding SYLF domain-containing protein n=1 Tax=Acidisoma cellulosilyticum TaxID=2802395 RepID=A0A963Z203_9PROT|nr:lipid-binding SYLF domain-containing protein [Acidisoma cellulosilyticum]MCB8880388.1 lipid-binding SYLF domain-containing protein [Acidisoma cellulosilyticum]
MLTRRMLFPATAAAGLIATAGISLPAHADSGPQDTVNHALGTLQDLRGDKEFGNALQLMRRARAVLIAPRIFKAGFFVGGEGGRAVLMARGANGSWSNPAFYTIASASFGLQIGAQESEMIMFVMSNRALNALMRNKFEFGANAGIAVATLGSTVAGATTSNGGPDIVVWASSSGVYAGISLDGTLVQPQSDANTAYYGRPLTSHDIVIDRIGRNYRAEPLVHAIDRL